MTDTTPTYKPGDVANGHVLTESGQWLPVGSPIPTGPGPKAKKPIWTRWWMIVIYTFVSIMIISAVASAGTDPATDNPDSSSSPKADGEVKNDASSPEQPKPEQPAADAPDAAQIGNWHLEGKPRLVQGAFDDFDLTLRVVNTSDEVDSPFIDATFLDKKGNILGTASCSGSDTKPGQVTTLSCYSGDAFDSDWATIEYQNSF